jgi:hypothetical protein
MRNLVFIILIVLLLFSGCNNENLICEQEQKSPEVAISNDFISTTLSLNEAINDSLFIKLTSEFGSLKSDEYILKSGKTPQKVTLKLDFGKIKKIKKGNYESFTILIKNEENDLKFSNLVIESKGNKKKALKLDYYPSIEMIISIEKGIKTKFKGQVYVTELNPEEINLKSTSCYRVAIYHEGQCPNPDCDGNPDCLWGCQEESYWEINTYCFDSSSGTGTATLTTTTSEIQREEGGGAPDADSYTNVVGPTVIPDIFTYFHSLFQIDYIAPADIIIEGLRHYDPNLSGLVEGENIAYDGNGGFYFTHQGYLFYYFNGFLYVDVTGEEEWYAVGTGLDYLVPYLQSVLGKPTQYLLSAFAQLTPINDFVTLITGTDVNNVQQNQYLAGAFLLFEVVPGVEVLKPVKNFLGNATKYIFKYGDDVIELVKVNGVVKFTEDAVEKLAKTATKCRTSSEVLLGKYIPGSLDSYEVIANNRGWCHFNLGEDWNKLKALTNGDEMWRLNKQFLDNCKAQNKTIYFYHDPTITANRTGGYLDEILYVESPEFGGTIVPEGSLWKVVF